MRRLVTAFGVLVLASMPAYAQTNDAETASADDTSERRGFLARTSKTGLTDTRPPFGGPNSPSGEIENTDALKEPAFRFPAIDEAFKPWNDWKTRQNAEHGFAFSAHYSTLFQGLTDALPGTDDKSSAGVLRATGKWTLLGRDTPNWGALNVMLDHRHGFRDTTPFGLAGSAGYIGVTGLFYNDIGFAVINLNWTQALNDGDTGLVVGRYDPNDYQNILGMVNPWTIFSNLATSLDVSVALPDSSWGIGAGHWVTDNFYVLGGINDANGFGADDLEFFEGGAEFYKYAHIGWSPSKADRYFKNIHVLAWHVDEREDAGIDSANGVSIAANWTFRDRFMPFMRIGFSNGAAPIYNESFTLGAIYKFFYRSDLVGLSINKGSPPDDSLRDQTTVEAFWRFQFAQNLAITPSVQLLIDPALNPEEDEVWVWGVRTRLTF